MMKRGTRIAALTIVTALLLSCGAAAETDIPPAERTVPVSAGMTFAFRSGITWDTTVDQMLEIMTEIEGVKLDGDIDIVREDHFTVYLVQGLTLGENPVNLAYYYRQERLIIVAYYFLPDPALTFSSLRERFIEEFGLPTDDDKTIVAALINVVTPGMVSDEDVTATAGWLFGDGTRMCLVDYYGEYSLYYFNVPVLLGETADHDDV